MGPTLAYRAPFGFHFENKFCLSLEVRSINCIFVNPVNLQNPGTLGVKQFSNRSSNNLEYSSFQGYQRRLFQTFSGKSKLFKSYDSGDIILPIYGHGQSHFSDFWNLSRGPKTSLWMLLYSTLSTYSICAGAPILLE